ncbi:MAG: response regulator [Patescibacteria group bacterium]|mgnify:FL=1
MKNILLVEDDRFLSRMYVEKLSEEGGFNVQAVEFGRQALEKIKTIKPDLILLDLLLPDMNGVQILKTIKEDNNIKYIRVLLLTNLNEKDYINEALSLGAEGYLIKAHFTPNEVVDKIKQILRS